MVTTKRMGTHRKVHSFKYVPTDEVLAPRSSQKIPYHLSMAKVKPPYFARNR